MSKNDYDALLKYKINNIHIYLNRISLLGPTTGGKSSIMHRYAVSLNELWILFVRIINFQWSIFLQ